MFSMLSHAVTVDWVMQHNPNLSRRKASELIVMIEQTAKKYAVDPKLVFKVIKVESHFDELALSRCGAKGLMQVMTKYHQPIVDGRNIWAPRVNVEVGVRILKGYLTQYGSVRKALHAYNGLNGSPNEYADLVLNTKLPSDRTMQTYRTVSTDVRVAASTRKARGMERYAMNSGPQRMANGKPCIFAGCADRRIQ